MNLWNIQCCFVEYVKNEAINRQIVVQLWEQFSMTLNPNFLPSQSLDTFLIVLECECECFTWGWRVGKRGQPIALLFLQVRKSLRSS